MDRGRPAPSGVLACHETTCGVPAMVAIIGVPAMVAASGVLGEEP